MNTTENNKLIAEFMGAKEIITETTHRIYKEFEMYGIIESIEDREDTKHFYQPEEMLFNSDWNWLMEVVEKIESLKSPYDGFSWSVEPFSVLINRNNVYIQVDAGKSDDISFPDMHCKTKIEMVYNTCVEFIKWYNEQSK